MRYFVLDTETIGLHVPEEGSGVVEFCAFEIDDEFNVINKYHSLINPEAPIAAAATATHGLRAEDVADKPTLAEYFYAVLDEHPWDDDKEPFYFIAHNARFDEKWLRDFLRCEYELVDTLKLARQFYPNAESHKLQVLRVELDLPFDIKDAHSADGDVETLLHFIKRMSEDTGLSISELCQEALKKAPLPTLFNFGKYRGQSIEEIAKTKPDYLKWCLENYKTMSDDNREALTKALAK